MERKGVKTKRIVLISLMGTVALFFLFLLVFRQTTIQTLTLSHQETGEIFLRVEAEAQESLTFTWIHSFEHIPWIEEYTVEDDNTFILHTIRVAGFGAGIPENKGTVSLEDGMVVYRDINEKFDHFSWINSQSALVSIALNDTILIRGTELPHHQKLELRLQGTRAICPRFPSNKQARN
ncbi:MAG TPA: DUF1850 domain-containing protein [Sphaerochaeta sp.]|nr:DUF1850 domain-containing protein [Sphaerochaeta sp.]